MIRAATPKDQQGIATVLKASYNISSLPEGKKVFAMEMKKGIHYIAAVVDGKIAGIVTWYMHGLPKHGLCELDRIAVLPAYKGKGIARELLEGLKKDAAAFYRRNKGKLRKLYLLTHDHNARAHAFYEKMGFRHETTLKDHYYKGTPERVYSIFYK